MHVIQTISTAGNLARKNKCMTFQGHMQKGVIPALN